MSFFVSFEPGPERTSRNHIPVRPRAIMSQEYIANGFGSNSRSQNSFPFVEKGVVGRAVSLGKMKLDSRVCVTKGRNKVSHKVGGGARSKSSTIYRASNDRRRVAKSSKGCESDSEAHVVGKKSKSMR